MNEWINERIASAVSEVRSWMSSDVGLLRHLAYGSTLWWNIKLHFHLL